MSGAGGSRPGIPGMQLVRSYKRSWLRPDLLAAVTVWALLVPQALAYAQLAKVDPVVGLYAAIGAAVGYVLLGGVRSMTVGPEGTIALLTATIVAPMAAGDATRYLALAGGLALVASGFKAPLMVILLTATMLQARLELIALILLAVAVVLVVLPYVMAAMARRPVARRAAPGSKA